MTDAIHVLYVEDNEGDIELFQIALDRYNKSSGIFLDIAETVEEAKERFDVQRHVAAILDWNLPDGQGLDVAQYIRSLSESLPIIFLSGAFTDELIAKTEIYHAAACLEKDYGKEYIKKMCSCIQGCGE